MKTDELTKFFVWFCLGLCVAFLICYLLPAKDFNLDAATYRAEWYIDNAEELPLFDYQVLSKDLTVEDTIKKYQIYRQQARYLLMLVVEDVCTYQNGSEKKQVLS